MDNKSPEAFRTISEVADWLGVPTHVLRFWESRFAQVKPVKRAGGRRYYRPADMELLGGIRKLLHEDGMTIRGVQKLLREKGVKHVASLSPAIDAPVDMREVGGTNVVDLADRRESADAEDEIEDAVEVVDEQPFPFAETEPAEGAEQIAAGTKSVFAEDLPEPAAGEMAEPDESEDISEAEEDKAEETAEAASEGEALADATIDPLSAPEAMEFLAHEAAPETDEEAFDTEAPASGAAAEAEPADAADAPDPFAGPEGLDFLAHEAPPETVEEPFGTGDAPGAAAAAEADTTTEAVEPSGVDVDGMAAQETSDATVEIEPAEPETVDAEAPAAASRPAPERPPLVLPELGPEPDDDADLGLPPATAIRLRRHRAARKSGVNVAALQALADRLDTLSGRLGQTPDRRRPF